MSSREADFWYLGCIDATLWWLLAVDFLDRRAAHRGLRARLQDNVQRAIAWLLCQEHQRFGLLQQNEASDWADIMPRSGFVLYSNALWYQVKRVYVLPDAAADPRKLQPPVPSVLARDRAVPARAPAHALRAQPRAQPRALPELRELLVLGRGRRRVRQPAGRAVRAGRRRHRPGASCARWSRPACTSLIRCAWSATRSWNRTACGGPTWAGIARTWPGSTTTAASGPSSGAFWAATLAEQGARARAQRELAKVARANQLGNWAFNEWLHGATHAASWHAGAVVERGCVSAGLRLPGAAGVRGLGEITHAIRKAVRD